MSISLFSMPVRCFYKSFLQMCFIFSEICGNMPASGLSSFSHVWLFATLWTVAARPFCPWDSPGKNIRVVCHALLQGILLTPAIKPASLTSPALAGGSSPLASPGKPLVESIKPLGQIALWGSQQPNHVSKEGPFPKRQGTSEHLRDLKKKNSHETICYTKWIKRGRGKFLHSNGVVQLLSQIWLFATHGLQHTRLPCPSLSYIT